MHPRARMQRIEMLGGFLACLTVFVVIDAALALPRGGSIFHSILLIVLLLCDWWCYTVWKKLAENLT